MVAFNLWQSWSRQGLQSNTDLWLTASRAQTRLTECHASAVQRLVKDWPDASCWQPAGVAAALLESWERGLDYHLTMQSILDEEQRTLARTSMRLQPGADPAWVEDWLARWTSPAGLAVQALRTTERAWKQTRPAASATGTTIPKRRQAESEQGHAAVTA